MNLLRLSTNSKTCLAAQVSLTGTFKHTLRNEHGVSSTVAVDMLQCTDGVSMMVHAGSNHTGSRFAKPLCPSRAARLIESVANGTPFSDAPFEEEYELVSETEHMLREAIQAQRGTYLNWTDDGIEFELIVLPGHAKIAVGETALSMQLPQDREQAYQLLSDNLQRFLHAVRVTSNAA